MTLEQVRLSRRVAYLLRHRPDAAGLELDAGGWVAVEDLLAALRVPLADLHAVVASNDKQRFAVVDGRIRAQQGHSVPVDLGLVPQVPPELLWHGTAERVLDAVLREGLQRRARHAVHLSADQATARTVGARHGRPVVLRVDAAGMHRDGHAFSRSGNGVWLVSEVPPHYLQLQ